MQQAIEDLRLDHLWVLYPGNKHYPLSADITVLPLAELALIRAIIMPN